VIDQVKATVKSFILREFLPGERPEELTDSTPLITGGILDSLATLKLVSFLEEEFGVTFEAHETDVDHLDTVSDVARLVEVKRGRS
jgi:acyl carrier protein